MTRGISDPLPIPEDQPIHEGDLPSMAEVDEALQAAFAEIGSLRTEINVLKDLLGAAIASNNRNANANTNHLTGL